MKEKPQGKSPSAIGGSVQRLVSTSGSSCSNHNFVEEYYGWRCSKCGMFYPNTEPLENWILNEPYAE